ncbi:MAG: DUF554 domain-containing protein [Bacteroidia bacterium]|nr:DUF554 domain-containing protein [Bacteroidia bacterium]
MLGTITNVCCIVVGSTIGALAKRALGEKYTTVLFNALGLASIVLGCNAAVSHMGKSDYPILFIMALAIGGIVGTAIDIDAKVQRALEKRGGSNAAQGLTTACLLFCIGTLSIVGPVLSAVEGDNTFLFTNATLDLFSSMMLASTFGIVIIWAAPILFCWQGSIYLIAKYLSSSFFSEGLINELSIVGGVLIICTGLSLLKIKDCKTLNLLPSLIIPIVFYLIK